jgi:hypothetical protein
MDRVHDYVIDTVCSYLSFDDLDRLSRTCERIGVNAKRALQRYIVRVTGSIDYRLERAPNIRRIIDIHHRFPMIQLDVNVFVADNDLGQYTRVDGMSWETLYDKPGLSWSVVKKHH